MDRDELADRLDAGRSIESIARELGRPPSTVAYWVNKHGLTSTHAPRYAPRGGIAREHVEPLVEDGRSVRQIAAALSVSAATVRHWLKRYELTTRPARYSLRGEPKPRVIVRECSQHGWTTFIRIGTTRYRCAQCNSAAVSDRRRKVKETLVREAGGACVLCGYERYAAPVPSSGSRDEGVRAGQPRPGAIARKSPARGGEVCPAVCKLPCRGGGRHRYYCA